MARIKEYRKGQKVKITEHFYSTEFDCNCKYPDCTKTLIDLDHVERLEAKRVKWDKKVTINSGYRCEKHNADEHGGSASRHKVGDASDIKVEGMTADEVAADCEDDFTGLGKYNTFTHLDSRPHKARWDFRTKKKKATVIVPSNVDTKDNV